MSDAARQDRQGPIVSGSQILAAGFAAAVAAVVTSRFGVAGTLLGTALTAMIITGGSAILKAYLETVTGNVRKAPRKLRERRNRWRAGRSGEPDTMPDRPDLRDNFAGRMRAALGWFSHLPPLMRRSILVKGVIGAAVAFAISMGAVYAVEKGIGNSLSCGIWGKCPEGTTPGIHFLGRDGTGAGSTLSGGRSRTNAGAPQNEIRNPNQQPGVDYQRPADNQEPGNQRPAPSNNEPGGGPLERERPVEREEPAQPEPPNNSASPEPENPEQPPADGAQPSGGRAPSGEAPAPQQ
jgi:hypothetical protein